MAGMSKLPAVYRHGFVLGIVGKCLNNRFYLFFLASSMAFSYWATVKWLRQRSKQLNMNFLLKQLIYCLI